MRLALLGPIAWRTPPRHYGPWELITGLLADGLAERGHRRDALRHARLGHRARSSTGSARVPTRRIRPWTGACGRRIHVAHALARSGDFDLDPQPSRLAAAGLLGAQPRAPWSPRSTASPSPRSCPPTGGRRAPSSRSRTPTAPPSSTTSRRSITASIPAPLPFSAGRRRGARVLRAHPPRQGDRTRRSRIARGAERPLVICGPVQDERYSARRSSRTSTASGCATSARSGPAERGRGARRAPPACCIRSPSRSRSACRWWRR